MSIFRHDGIEFHYRDEGAGIPFVFQHGLGADVTQPFELFAPSATVRLLAFDCRGHGKTEPLGNSAKLSIPYFADDLRVFLDHLQISAAVIGGTSMGAAVAMNFALRHPTRVLGVILSRPAWLDKKNPDNLQSLAVVSRLLRQYEPSTARELFLKTDSYTDLLQESVASADSVLQLFSLPQPLVVASYLEAIPQSRPCNDLQELHAIKCPVLILANRLDPIHPFEYASQLAKHIPSSEIVQITPRIKSVEEHRNDVHRSIGAFLESKILHE